MTASKPTAMIFRLVATGVLAVFLAAACRETLLADFTAGSYTSLLLKVVFLLSAAVLLGLRAGGIVAAERNMRPMHLVLVALFCGVLFYPLLSHVAVTGKSFVKVSSYLQRTNANASKSSLAVLRQFPGTFEKYWQDNTILAKAYIHLNALVKVYLFKVSPNTTVALGKNGFYYEGYGARKVEKGVVEKFDNIADYMGQFPFSTRELWKWKQTLEERSYWLKKQGVEYVFVLAPTKALVYPEFLPQSLQNLKKGRRRYDQLSAYLHENARVHFVDLLPPLLQAKRQQDYPLLFYKTDFHWNFYGSLIAYQAIVRQMQTFFPEYPFAPLILDDFTVKIDKHWAHHRFMDMIGLPVKLHKNEHYVTMVPKPGSRLYGLKDLPPEGIHDVYPPNGRLTSAKGEVMKIRMVRNPAAPIPSILLLGDSFMEKCVYYFSANAREVWNYRTVVNFPVKIFAYEKPTFVIQEILNMFILRKPPENPSTMRQQYLAAQFAASTEAAQDGNGTGQKLIVKDGHTRIGFSVNGWRWDIGHVIRINLDAPTKSKVEVAMQLADGEEFVWAEEQVRAGSNMIYVSIPPGQKIQDVLLRRVEDNGSRTTVVVGNVVFRALE